MREGHEIIDKVYAAKSDPDAADSLIRQYMGFIRSETAKFLHRPPEEGRDEEFSIAMLAFYESILGYEKWKRGIFILCSKRNQVTV
mgnify:CR=1 FL=1